MTIIMPDSELMDFYQNDSSLSIKSWLTELFASTQHRIIASEIYTKFSVNQIMKVIILSAYLVTFPEIHKLHNRATYFLNNYLAILKRNQGKLPFLHAFSKFGC